MCKEGHYTLNSDRYNYIFGWAGRNFQPPNFSFADTHSPACVTWKGSPKGVWANTHKTPCTLSRALGKIELHPQSTSFCLHGKYFCSKNGMVCLFHHYLPNGNPMDQGPADDFSFIMRHVGKSSKSPHHGMMGCLCKIVFVLTNSCANHQDIFVLFPENPPTCVVLDWASSTIGGGGFCLPMGAGNTL